MEKHKHLDLDARIAIEVGLKNRKSFKQIAREIGKDCSTVSKEVRNHLHFVKTGSYNRNFNDCKHRKDCSTYGLCKNCVDPKHGHHCRSCRECMRNCYDYEKETCPKQSKPPYACNGCLERRKCSLEKAMYSAGYAYNEYLEVKSESRSGIGMSEEEVRELDMIVTPLLRNGQSIHHICSHNADMITVCEKTLYKYADAGLLTAINLDMPRKVAFRPRRVKSTDLKVDKKCRIGRTLEDYHTFMEENPSCPVVQADTVEGIKGGAVLLTLHFVSAKLQLAFKREHNDAASVTKVFNMLYDTLGKEEYLRLFKVILADNGSEFSDPRAIEFDENGNRRSYVFYCDPSSPYQKGACENNHEFIRRIIPKGKDIGIYSDDKISLMMDHINSYGRAELADKAPLEMFEFLYGGEVVKKLGLKLIPKNEVILKPSLLNRNPAPVEE